MRRLAEAEALRNLTFGHSFEITSGTIRSIITARRLLDQYFWPSMTEAAWTVILELFANRLSGRRITVKALSIATETPVATTLHWIEWLVGRGTVSLNAGPEEEESDFIDLTDAGADQIRAYLFVALALTPWVQ